VTHISIMDFQTSEVLDVATFDESDETSVFDQNGAAELSVELEASQREFLVMFLGEDF